MRIRFTSVPVWMLLVLACGSASGADIRYNVTHLQAVYGSQTFFVSLSSGGSYLWGSSLDENGVYIDAFVADSQGLRNLGIPENWGVTSGFSESGLAYGIEVGGPGNEFTGVFSVTASGVIEHAYTLQGTSMFLGHQNGLGQIVGDEEGGTLSGSAGFLYTPGVGAQSFDTLGGVEVTRFSAINDAGWIIGNGVQSTAQGVVGGAWLWVPGQEAVLIREGFPEPVAINDSGQIVGFSGSAGFFWENGSFQVISNVLVPDPNNPALIRNAAGLSGALDVNASGVVSGFGEISMVPGYSGPIGLSGWIWTETEGLLFLDDLIDPASGIKITGGVSIADDGTILAAGRIPGSTEVQHFLLTPIPEPGAGVLLLLASCGLLRRRRRGCRP